MKTIDKWFMPKGDDRKDFLTVTELYKIITIDNRPAGDQCSEDISCPLSKHGSSKCESCAGYLENKHEVLNYIKKQTIEKLKS